MRLLRAQHYLCLSSAPETESDAFSLRFSSDLKSLLRTWGPTTRISPIWRLVPNMENAQPSNRQSSRASVFFVCGASPDLLARNLSNETLGLLGDDSIYLTLGGYSLCIISYFDEVTEEVRDLCKRHQLPYETWIADEILTGPAFEEFRGDIITHDDPADFLPTARDASLPTTLLDNNRIVEDDTLGVMAMELYALLAVIENRAPLPFRCLARDCREIGRIANVLITARVEDDTVIMGPGEKPLVLPEAEPQDLLLTLNASLSRHASQALSGTTPIMRTECHFWPHSLLGTGVANLALRNLAHFISKVLAESRYHERFDILAKAPASVAPKNGRNFPDTTHLRLSLECLAKYQSQGNVALNDQEDQQRFVAPVPITYYSGRDGFTNNALTISAPLSCVSGCASYQWNLGTITHELSHRVVSGKLQTLFNVFLDDIARLKSCSGVMSYFESAPTNVEGHAARLAGFGLLALHIEDYTDGKIQSLRSFPAKEFFRVAKERYSVLLEETLVHIFDFYHFYGADPKLYVDFVWRSWAVQPSITQKGDEYIKRTLVALAVQHVMKDDWMELAIADFESVLQQEPLASTLGFSDQISRVLRDKDTRENYEHHLEQMQYVLNLFHLIFKSDMVRQLAYDDEWRSPRKTSHRSKSGARHRTSFNYPCSPGIFVSTRANAESTEFSNPFRFLRDYSRRQRPNAGLSAWLLHMLAFGYLPDPPPESPL